MMKDLRPDEAIELIELKIDEVVSDAVVVEEEAPVPEEFEYPDFNE